MAICDSRLGMFLVVNSGTNHMGPLPPLSKTGAYISTYLVAVQTGSYVLSHIGSALNEALSDINKV